MSEDTEDLGPYPDDTLIEWDSTDPLKVDEARETFRRLVVDQKQRAFTVNDDGSQGDLVPVFDPSIEALIFSPLPDIDHLHEAHESLKRLARFRGQTSHDDIAQSAIAHALVDIASSLHVDPEA